MTLYMVKIEGVCPTQCVTVTDCKNRATALCEAIRGHFPHLGELVNVAETAEFYPAGYTDADTNVARFAFNWSLVN